MKDHPYDKSSHREAVYCTPVLALGESQRVKLQRWKYNWKTEVSSFQVSLKDKIHVRSGSASACGRGCVMGWRFADSPLLAFHPQHMSPPSFCGAEDTSLWLPGVRVPCPPHGNPGFVQIWRGGWLGRDWLTPVPVRVSLGGTTSV